MALLGTRVSQRLASNSWEVVLLKYGLGYSQPGLARVNQSHEEITQSHPELARTSQSQPLVRDVGTGWTSERFFVKFTFFILTR